MSEKEMPKATAQRLFSLDFFRGFTMFMLVGSGLYELMRNADHSIVSEIGWQFEHRYWHGLTLWDFVEPFFMFIVGVAIPFSVMNRLEKGDSWNKVFRHVLQRSIILFFLGILIYSVSSGKPVWRLWNVLTQLSVTYVFAFLLMRKSITLQLLISLFLLLLSESLYRSWPVEGFNQPFVADHNFGSWLDLKLMGELESDHWVAFNVVPTAALTIWGVVAGLILRSNRTHRHKIRILLTAGAICVSAGFALGFFTPMIKRIGTSSIILETGGWSIIMLAFSYWLVDVMKIRKVPAFFAVVGMNSLFIYLFEQTGGASFLARIVKPFAYTCFFWLGETGVNYGTAVFTWFLLWYICYWLYKRKIFIKI
ncbi:MAG: DUF5009 domain-containing protein [Candidatus Pedobacter colombiensis]|uniref:DUF5009 domain-containing protein n=1 Tax=Candidatus Pedobacter colombiensis TaxID=3121371 RepID=A0AAJ5WAF9_9SPHI|nr:DUF5009 domain-containing protein [Pedobacter sp.]WEK20991.1 MAG: DUF5009 domain-containing protein [Pedobacter sp.]